MSAIVKVKQRRADRLGASDAPVVLGFVATRGPIDTWLRFTGRKAPEPANDAMNFGNEYEPIIRGRYVNKMGVRVWVPGESLLHPTLDFLQATPDGICLTPTAPDITTTPAREHWSHGLEVKAPRARQRPDWGEEGSETVPMHVLIQVVVQMSVTGMPYTDIAAEIDREYLQRRIHRDMQFEGEVLTALEEFWGYVKNDTPPPVDATDSYSDYLRHKLSKTYEIVDATPEMDAIAAQWRDAEVDLKAAKARVDLHKNQMMAAMTPLHASCVKTAIGKINMQEGRVTHDDKALALELCIRLQLRGESVDFAAERERFRRQGDPFPRRPNSWTKE